MKYLKQFNESLYETKIPNGTEIVSDQYFSNEIYYNIQSFSTTEITKIKNVFSPILNNINYKMHKNNLSLPFIIYTENIPIYDMESRSLKKFISISSKGKTLIKIYKIKDDYFLLQIRNTHLIPEQYTDKSYKSDQISSITLFLKQILYFFSKLLYIDWCYIKNIKYFSTYGSFLLNGKTNLYKLNDEEYNIIKNNLVRNKEYLDDMRIVKKNNNKYYIILSEKNILYANNISSLIFLLNYTNCLNK